MSQKAASSRNASSAVSSNLDNRSSVGPDERKPRTAAQCLSHLCFSEHLSDISFTFSDDESVKLSAHKFVLSMRSDVFETMFYGTLAEGGETVLIKDVKPDVMKTILRFVYTDKPDIDGKNVLPCLYAAKKYNLPGLENHCSSFLQNEIDETNVCHIIEQAVLYEMKPLQQRCISFIVDNATGVLSSPGFIELSHATLLNILKSDELAIDEIDVFKAAMKWAEHNCQSNVGQNMRDHLGEAFFHIRFPLMPTKEFARVVTPSGVLANEEILMLYEFKATNGSTPLRKFKKEKRQSAPMTLDLREYKKYKQQMRRSFGCFLNIQAYNNRIGQTNSLFQINRNRKSIKLKSVTGEFVGNVTGIVINEIHIPDFKTIGDKIIFENPIGISGGILMVFYFNNEDRNNFGYGSRVTNNVTYNARKLTRVDGIEMMFTDIPDGLETITFVYI